MRGPYRSIRGSDWAMVGALLTTGATAGFVPGAPQGVAVSFTRVAMPGPTTDRGSTGGVSWVDVDRDGDPDLVSVNGFDVSRAPATPQQDLLYLNDGRGGLTAVAGWPPIDRQVFSSGSTWGDFDNDGDPDVFIASQRRVPGVILRTLGGARFERVMGSTPATDSLPAYSSAFVDIDGDGFLDLTIVTGGLSSLSTNTAYRGLGDGRFERVPGLPFTTDSAASGGGVWADIDDDGDQDLFVPVNGIRGRFRHLVYRNDGNWQLVPVSGPGIAESPATASAAAWADIDNDGDLDLSIGNWPDFPGVDEENILLRNDTPPRGWMRLELEGTRSNRSAIGARVVVTTTIGGRLVRQRRDVSAHTTFRSLNDPVQHVGLGDARGVESVEVRWPSGHIDTCAGLPVSASVRVLEGRGWQRLRPAGPVTPCR